MSKRPRPLKTQAQLEAEKLIQRAKDLEAVSLPPSAAVLERQHDIEVTRQGAKRDGQKANHDTARRLDAFAALKDGMVAGAFDAARRLERDVLVRLGLGDARPAMERVDHGQCSADHRVLAGLRVDEVLDRLAPRDSWLLMELIAPAVDRGSWRDHVAYITGEKHTEAQSAAVRAVCVNLRDAYAALERRAA